MGSTYGVYDVKSGPVKKFAIKIMDDALARRDPAARKHFIHEAKATMALQHPNIVEVHFLDELPDGTPLYAMELLNGKSVSALIAELGAIHPLVAVNLVIDALDGVHEAHKHGLVHQDFKPSNIMTHREKKTGLLAKVIDFGVVRMQDDCDKGFAGTFAYAAPEQARGANIGPWTDVFGAGAALFEMLTGKRPFASFPSSAAGLVARIDQPAPSLLDFGEFHRELVMTVAAALSPLPSGRPQSAKAFASLLRIIGSRLDVPSSKETEKVSQAAAPLLRAQLEEATNLQPISASELNERQEGAPAPLAAGVSATLASPLVPSAPVVALQAMPTRPNGKAAALAPATPASQGAQASVVPQPVIALGRSEIPEQPAAFIRQADVPISRDRTHPPSRAPAYAPNVQPLYIDGVANRPLDQDTILLDGAAALSRPIAPVDAPDDRLASGVERRGAATPAAARKGGTLAMYPVGPSGTRVMDVGPVSAGVSPVVKVPNARPRLPTRLDRVTHFVGVASLAATIALLLTVIAIRCITGRWGAPWQAWWTEENSIAPVESAALPVTTSEPGPSGPSAVVSSPAVTAVTSASTIPPPSVALALSNAQADAPAAVPKSSHSQAPLASPPAVRSAARRSDYAPLEGSGGQ
jgi:serine/threonine protein kinase